MERSKSVVEGSTLVNRVIDDRLAVETVLSTLGLSTESAGTTLFNYVHQPNLLYYRLNDGLRGAVTTTRPVPSLIASD